jgi:hypothetical protein
MGTEWKVGGRHGLPLSLSPSAMEGERGQLDQRVVMLLFDEERNPERSTQ